MAHVEFHSFLVGQVDSRVLAEPGRIFDAHWNSRAVPHVWRARSICVMRSCLWFQPCLGHDISKEVVSAGSAYHNCLGATCGI